MADSDKASLLLVACADAIAREYALTSREGEVLLELVRCESYDEIADALAIARSTARTHAKQVFRKTATTSRRALTLLVAFGIRPKGATARADEGPRPRDACVRGRPAR
ncbi:MAG TPA: helix-turn-helix transcriptional regulator [Nannocystaceae bacterium]|nr:helix-turn-helix transcriptional regulator [Nannocystaceae bacterium]